MPVRHFYLLSHYSCNGLFFLFSVCWLHVNEFNSLWGDKGKKSEDYYLLGRYLCHGILFTRSHITVAMLSPLCWLFSSFTDDKIISLYMIYLLLSCRNISFFSKRMSYVLYNAHLAVRMPRRSWIRMYDKYKGNFCTFL